MTGPGPHAIAVFPIHLGLGGQAVPQPAFTGMGWYADYASRVACDGADGRLVSMHAFTQDWESWERHPAGHEVVLCVAGEMVLHQELGDGIVHTLTLGAGDYSINPPGVWHTADVENAATAVFITSGLGTDHRPR